MFRFRCRHFYKHESMIDYWPRKCHFTPTYYSNDTKLQTLHIHTTSEIDCNHNALFFVAPFHIVWLIGNIGQTQTIRSIRTNKICYYSFQIQQQQQWKQWMINWEKKEVIYAQTNSDFEYTEIVKLRGISTLSLYAAIAMIRYWICMKFSSWIVKLF